MTKQKSPTQEQLNIIQTTEGYIRCGAVPGSGKTFCITHRIAYLITALYVDPSSIVALTFTNKAAASMKSRLKQLIGDEANCFTGTFHGYCNKLLKEEIHRLSYPKTFTILDKGDQINLIREIAEEQAFSLKDFSAKRCLEDIGRRKLSGEYIEYMLDSGKNGLMAAIADAEDDMGCMYYNYLLKQRDNYLLDFEDIINLALYILENYPDALARWQDACQYILCDEYQDVNEKQERLLRLLSGKYHNLTVVGDDDQCIYGWRGSKVDYMVDFDKAYPGAQDFYLSENFRSTPQIIAIANSLIEHNQHRLEKRMFTNNPAGNKPPVYNNAKTEREEALWIANMINAENRSIEAGKKESIRYSDYAILVRAASQTRAIEEAFIEKKVPYKILSGAQFYSSEAIKTVLAYLRMVYSMNDVDFVWTIQRPRKGFGKKAIENLKHYAKQQNLSLIQALGEQIEQGIIKKQAVVEYYNAITKLHAEYQNYSAKELVGMVLDMGYREALEQDVDQTKLDNVSEFLVTVSAMEEENQDRLPLEELLAHFALFSQQDDDTNKDVVRVMTVHAAKGLEFENVFINGLVDGQFPSDRLKNEDEMEEERRLFYVAVTRAKKMLYLSSYDIKAGSFGARQSAFLRDIDEELLDCINGSKIIKVEYNTPPMISKAQFNVGDMVVHGVFGQGKIVAVNEECQYYEIFFELMEQTRRIMFRADLIKN